MTLKSSLKKDLEVFFNVDEFADKVSYFIGSTSTDVTVQFYDEESAMGDTLLRKMVIPIDEIPNLSRDGYFIIGGNKYGVIDFFPDEQNLIFNVITQKGMK